MEKLFAILLVVLFFLTACQATPKADIVVQKNTEQMIEAAKATPSAPPMEVRENEISPLYARFNIPEHYAVVIAPSTEKLTITVDAQVELPVAAGMPTVRVRARDVTQDEVYRMFNALCGDTEMYYYKSERTKAQYEQMLISNQQELAEMKESGTSAERIAKIEENIAWIEKQILTAPESIPDEVCDGTMREEQLGLAVFLANQMRFSAVDEEGLKDPSRGAYFGACTNAYNINHKERYDYETNSTIGYISGRSGKSLDVNPIEYIEDESAVPPEAKGELSLTPAQVRAMVAAFLKGNGFKELAVAGVYLADNKGNQVTEMLEDSYGEKHAYAVVCGRAVNGVAPRFVSESFSSEIGEDADMKSWVYERCYFFVDDSGILEFHWNSPYEYMEVVTEDTALLPFEKISEIFQKMMLVKNEASAGAENVTHLTFHVDRVALELQRVAEQDSVDTGLLVPVWNFYGTWLYEYSDIHSYSSQDRQGFPQSFLTINAIDGSIINARAGY